MKIIADENIPFVKQAFSSIGETDVLPTGQINEDNLKDADVLLVRSKTAVDQKLLEGSSVKFVATATIGIDHIDTEYLKRRNIGFANAAGCNANSVAEYVFAAMLHLSRKLKFPLGGKVLGVVGVGNIGSKVVRMAKRLGMKVLQNDPPLKRETGDSRFVPLDDLMDADLITVHVPLTREGRDATLHLFDKHRIEKMKKGSILINSSRGAVVDGEALKSAVHSKHFSATVLDVWENEPEIDLSLLDAVDIGTSHIAGYSLDGKVNGTVMIREAVCRYFNLKTSWDHREVMPEPEVPFLTVEKSDEADEDVLNQIVKKVYNIEKDDARLRQIFKIDEPERGAFFHRLRKEYPIRREFFNTELKFSNGNKKLADKFAALGFKISV